jgi:hypothetical protein
MVAMDSKMARDNGADPEAPPSERRGSLVVDPNLASEEDAAVLAKMGYVYTHMATQTTRLMAEWLETNSFVKLLAGTSKSFAATSA